MVIWASYSAGSARPCRTPAVVVDVLDGDLRLAHATHAVQGLRDRPYVFEQLAAAREVRILRDVHVAVVASEVATLMHLEDDIVEREMRRPALKRAAQDF